MSVSVIWRQDWKIFPFQDESSRMLYDPECWKKHNHVGPWSCCIIFIFISQAEIIILFLVGSAGRVMKDDSTRLHIILKCFSVRPLIPKHYYILWKKISLSYPCKPISERDTHISNSSSVWGKSDYEGSTWKELIILHFLQRSEKSTAQCS